MNKTVAGQFRYVLVWSQTILFIVLFIHHAGTHAAPQGGAVTGGTGSISQSGAQTTINQTSQNMAIDWQSYNVNTNERVQYIQPNAGSLSLNRILDNSPSQIRGRIDANGQIILVNPNGIFFSPDSVVNVGGIVATGLVINPADFMNGHYIFRDIPGTDGVVINSGLINASTGGYVTLLGKQVKNDGLISARLGRVNLAAGKEVVLKFDNHGLIGIEVTKEVLQNEIGVDPAVLNSGTIQAEGGQVLLTASTSRDIFSRLTNVDQIQATSVVVHENGSFTLGGGADVENSGTIDVSNYAENAVQPTEMRVVLVGENVSQSSTIRADNVNGNGGEIELTARDTVLLNSDSQTTARSEANGTGGLIKVLGDKVGLIDDATVDASGAHGGGTVLIGGDQEGHNPFIPNANFLYLGEHTQVRADALDNGDGGTVIAFAENTARIYSSLSARGGINGGNGGFIETSGLIGFDLIGAPDVSAPAGIGGEWLIDPYNITISGSNTNEEIQQPDAFTFEAIATGANVNVADIYTALKSGDVTIRTSAPGDAGTEAGDITWLAFFNYHGIGNETANRTLTLQADGNINFALNRYIHDGSNDNENLSVNLFAIGNITLGQGVEIETRGGDFTVGGIVNNVNYYPTYFEQGSNTAFIDTRGSGTTGDGDGHVTITTNGADIGVGVNLGRIDTGNGNLTITANGGTIMQSGNTTRRLNVNGLTTLTALGQDVTLSNTSNNFNQVNINAASATLYDTDTIRLGDSILTGTAGNVLTVTTNNGNMTQAANTTLTASGTGANVRLTAGGNNNITQGSNAALINNGSGSLTTLTATGGNIVLDNTGNDFTRVSANSDAITLRDANAIELGAFSNTQNSATLTVTTDNGSITQTGLISYTGDGTLIRLTANGTGSDILQNTRLINNGNNALTDLTAANAITLTNNNNDFTQVAINSASAILSDSNDVDMATTTITGSGTSLQITALGDGNITQSGRISNVNGTTTLQAVGNDITLTDGLNDFATVSFVDARNVNLHDTNDIVLAGSNVSGTLDITTNGSGNISQSGTLNISGITTLNAGNTVTLDDLNNNFQQQVNVTAVNATLVDTNAIELGSISISGSGNSLNVTANNGDITQTTGTLINNSNGTTILTANGNAVTLTNAGNNFGSLSIGQADTVSIFDTNSINLGSINITTSLNISTNGNITNTGGAIVLADTATAAFIAGNNGSISLTDAGNRFTLPVALSSSGTLTDVAVTNTVATEVNVGDRITGDLDIISGGDITSTNALTVDGATTLSASGAAVTLTDPNHNFTLLNVTSANSVEVTDTNVITIGTVNAGTVAVEANQIALGRVNATTTTLTARNGQITDANGDNLNLVGDTATLSATDGVGVNDPLETQLNQLTVTSGSGAIGINNTGTLTVKLATSGDISLTNNGDVYLDLIDAEANGDTHSLIELTIINGSVFSAVPQTIPDIRGHDVTVIVNDGSGDFGGPGSPITIDIHGVFTLLANISNYDFYNSIPSDIVDNSTIRLSIGSLFSLLSGQKLIEVESMFDIDPAIFTAVRNFYHDDIAILLPPDQRYTEDDDVKYRQTSVR
ncbi:MAG: filamentous hemagglutinin N-terminal domain-containing protein [Gammaproteobacteria bacterium]|nr:filamentous hemagglutinin N-terminal domain-containing protein [Gammaproteobacteria bacterium]